MQVSPIFDAVWKTMRRCLNRPVGFALATALLVVITYQLVSKPATAQGINYSLSGKATKSVAPHSPQRKPGFQFQPAAFSNRAEPEGVRQRWVVKLDLVGANSRVRLTGRDETGAIISYFKGPQAQWRTGLKSYATLVYEELWPGIELFNMARPASARLDGSRKNQLRR